MFLVCLKICLLHISIFDWFNWLEINEMFHNLLTRQSWNAYFRFEPSTLLIFIVTDLMLTGSPFLVHVSQWMCGWVERSWSSGEPLRFAWPHWLNHQPVLFCCTLQLSTDLPSKVQKGMQPSLSTSDVLKGAVSWFCSCSYPLKASPASKETKKLHECDERLNNYNSA